MNRRFTFRFLAVIFVQLCIISSLTFVVLAFSVLIHTGIAAPALLKPMSMLLLPTPVSILVSIPISIWLCNWYLKPIEEIRDATNKMAKGDFSVRVVEWNGENEIASLQRSFNRMAQELDNTEMFRSDFINTFSHEFKTPIVSIRGFAKQLNNPDLTEEQRQEYINIIVNESDRLANMSSNVLLLSKFENVEIITDREPFSLDEQIRNVILLLEKKWTAKNLELDIELESVTITNNQEMIQHIWNNLLDNAIKFSPHNGTLSVRCRFTNAGQVIVRISDQGIGMTCDEISHIYDKFYQADTSHVTTGNGLGLSIVRRIVKLTKGHIDVTSTPGDGTTFTVILPVE